MFTRSHLHCCFSPKPTWFLPLSRGFSGLLVFVGLWHRVRNWDLAVSVYPVKQHMVFIPCRELFIFHLVGLEGVFCWICCG